MGHDTKLLMERPQRWDTPFGQDMSDADTAMLLARSEFESIDASRFPDKAPLAGILKNDCRINFYRPGDVIVREGDYGNSAFLVLSGTAGVVLPPGLPSQLLGRSTQRKKGLLGALAQLWTNSKYPEARDTRRYANTRADISSSDRTSLLDIKNPEELFTGELAAKEKDVPRQSVTLNDAFKSATLKEGSLFGEIAALGRVQRTATVYAQSDCRLLEMRWQALRDIKARDETWNRIIEDSYRKNQLKIQLREHPLLAGFDDDTLQKIADATLFETYGSFEWYQAFRQQQRAPGSGHQDEPRVASQGDYPDGLLLVGGGFGRISVSMGTGERTLSYLREGDHFGLDELYDAWTHGHECSLETSLSALGYLHILRVPYGILCDLVFPNIEAPKARIVDAEQLPIASDAVLEWAVEERFIIGTQAMLINTERCVRCDDCVRACAASHDGNPRFIRHGKRHGSWMVANACMHCVDPVCMIGCPTGAIHRTVDGGAVVINDDTCIGCGTCANSCPFDNIRLVPIRDRDNKPVLDPRTQEPIVKATKCDLCSAQIGGPACVQACPHDALRRVDFQTELRRWGAT